MPLTNGAVQPSGRMGALWTAGAISDCAVLEFGSMGHMLYAEKWMEQSGIYPRARLVSTHLDEKDISLGLTRRLEEALEELAEDPAIQAVFLLPSSVPEMIGTDIGAIGEQLQERYPHLPIIQLGTGGFSAGLEKGIEDALDRVVERFIRPEWNASSQQPENTGFNIIGSISDSFNFLQDAREVARLMEGTFHRREICTLTSGSSVKKLRQMGESGLNLVLRREGEKAAVRMKKERNIPYLAESPYGYQGTQQWLLELEELLHQRADREFLEKELGEHRRTLEAARMWTKYSKERAHIHISAEARTERALYRFACDELGMQQGEGGIFIAPAHRIEQEGRGYRLCIPLTRTTKSCEYNLYAPPYMGFRGAMNLCSLWIQYLMER